MQKQKTLTVEVRVVRKELSRAASRALDAVSEYDWVLFTSKNAVTFFVQEVRKRKIQVSNAVRIAAVGPETAAALRAAGFSADVIPERFTVRDMVKSLGSLKGKRVLFPRSAVAPQEPIQILRAQGARVNVVPLYYPVAVTLSQSTRRELVDCGYSHLEFKSPSGITGFMRQLSAGEKAVVRTIPALCIGPTTAKAAKEAGFRHVSTGVL
jgi:uroporphyrinogen III methyltransferase/synthase